MKKSVYIQTNIAPIWGNNTTANNDYLLVKYNFSLSNIQDEIESAMDEITNNRSIIVSNTEETGSKARGLVSQTFFNATNTRNSGKRISVCEKLYI